MKKNNLFLFSTIFFILIFINNIGNIYGHGWGIDTTSIDVEGRDISISIEIPQYFDASNNKFITVTAIDDKTKESVEDVTFLIGLYKNNEIIFRNYFFTPDGNLLINVVPTEEGETKIVGQKDSLLEAWYATDSQPIKLEGPIFNSGGLFNFEVELRTIDEPTNIVENLGVYSVDVSMVETVDHNLQSIDGNLVNFKSKSYFDNLNNFNFDSKNNILTFQMPFNWSEKIISHVPVVHTEVHFPKGFVDFIAPSYIGKVNGIELFKSNVIIDDYTEESERIIHFVLLQDHLQYLKQEQKKINQELPDYMLFSLQLSDIVDFPMTAFTRDEIFQVDLSWDPVQIEPEKNTKFIFTIRDATTGEPLRKSTYDFIILQNNIELYKTSGEAQVGGDFKQYTFKEDQTGPTVIRFENIRGSESGTEFGLVVVPEFGLLGILVLGTGLFVMITIYRRFFTV